MKLPTLVQSAARLLCAMYEYSPFLAGIPWHAAPSDADANTRGLTNVPARRGAHPLDLPATP
jgi:hypothetical protein